VKAERGRAFRVRRSPHVLIYWRDGQLIIRNYATGVATTANPLVCAVLDLCGDWQTATAVSRAFPAEAAIRIPALIGRLVERSFLERSDQPQDPRVRAMTIFDSWNPEAGFFHTATKDVRYWPHQTSARRSRNRGPKPDIRKRYRGVERIHLPRTRDGEFARIAAARRTWRRFSKVPLTLEDLATILGVSVGVQKWARVDGNDIPLKTSPSGGARHPIECYAVVRDVAGLKRGIYHYAADRHDLERIGGPVSTDRMRAYVPQSRYFANGSAMVFFTAVFERQVWRYSYARAYRATLIEAGHVCQTFLLAATSLGLAPYCVMGLADSLIEGDLGIDGITESVLYCAGVGRPPRGTTWAPLPRGTLKIRPNNRLLRG
jgi:SagB-type dehydrogenase family enzyme